MCSPGGVCAGWKRSVGKLLGKKRWYVGRCWLEKKYWKRLPGPAGKQHFWSVLAGSAEQIEISQRVEKLLQKG